MYYFAYCTWLNDPEIRRYMPHCKPVTKAYAANYRLQFHSASGRQDRGWRHINGVADAWGEKCWGVVFGDDGRAYDCWTYRMITLASPCGRRISTGSTSPTG